MQHQPVKDYYRLLGISPQASPEDIKKAYRRLAFANHPDRNPDNRSQAENRFKEITEAYGILIDPQKRARYDHIRKQGSAFEQAHARTQRGAFSREQVLRDLFQNPYARQIFKDLEQEFRRQGFCFDSNFVKKTLFGGKGVFIGGIFFISLFGSRGLSRQAGEHLRTRSRRQVPAAERVPLLRKLGEKAGLLPADEAPSGSPALRKKDRLYELRITPVQAARGDHVAIQVNTGHAPQKLWVTIPPGIRSGTRLRLAGKGKPGRLGSPPGDLFIKIIIENV